MSKTAIISPELTPPVGPFSQAIQVDGLSVLQRTGRPRPCHWQGGRSAVLKAASKSFDDVVRAGVFLTNMTDFVAMNGIYAKHFSQPPPARTTIGVAALPLWGLR